MARFKGIALAPLSFKYGIIWRLQVAREGKNRWGVVLFMFIRSTRLDSSTVESSDICNNFKVWRFKYWIFM